MAGTQRFRSCVKKQGELHSGGAEASAQACKRALPAPGPGQTPGLPNAGGNEERKVHLGQRVLKSVRGFPVSEAPVCEPQEAGS